MIAVTLIEVLSFCILGVAIGTFFFIRQQMSDLYSEMRNQRHDLGKVEDQLVGMDAKYDLPASMIKEMHKEIMPDVNTPPDIKKRRRRTKKTTKEEMSRIANLDTDTE